MNDPSALTERFRGGFFMQTLRLDQLRIDGGTQLRVKIDLDHVAELKAAWNKLEDLPPFVAFHDGAAYWIADGFHRFHAATGKWMRVSVDVRQGTQRDAILYACGANQTHGLKRSNADKRKAVKTLLDDQEWSKKSDRWIAEASGVSHTFVAEMRPQVATVATCESKTVEKTDVSEKREGRDGKKQSATKPNKPKAAPVEIDEPEPSKPKISGGTSFDVEEIEAHGKTRHVDWPKGVAEALDSGEEVFAKLIGQLGRIEGEVKRLLDSKPGGHLTQTDVEQCLANAKASLKTCRPVCPCPMCKGQGCASCKKAGWWCDQQRKQLETASAKLWLAERGF